MPINTKKITNNYYKIVIKNLVKHLLKDLKNKILLNYMYYKKQLNLIYSILDKSVKKRIFHKNTVARKKSKITKSLNHVNFL